MALEIQKGKSRWWYGRVVANGKTVFKNLGVKIEGVCPSTLKNLGDPVFERSRAKAQAALEKLQDDLKKQSSAEELVQTVHEIRTGRRITSIPLNEIYARWESYPRHRKPNERYCAQVKRQIERFVQFIKTANPAVREMSSVQSQDVKPFLAAEERRGISSKTYNNVLIGLRSVFTLLRREAGSPDNPFDFFPAKESETVFRKPYSPAELTAILKAAKADPFIEPIIVTGICTAMRRGDCCLLPWSAVDMESRFIGVKTSKTREMVQIPIFPLLEACLKQAKGNGSKLVFPSQAAMYRSNPDGITYRVKKVLEAAGIKEDLAPAELSEDGSAAATTAKRGKSKRKGLRKASVKDFHSFRVTWVTLALTAGVPIEVVQRVTGHQTAQIVQKHYFQPGKEDFRRALTSRMPELVAGGEEKPGQELQAIRKKLGSLNADNWETVKAELLADLELLSRRSLALGIGVSPSPAQLM
jgi:integrase